ncbi:MAG: glycosyltransferase family 39 protein [Anaerolineales bacterium]|nr:glycosyltransferase family 39 protein [Anaerolineales bacterium]
MRKSNLLPAALLLAHVGLGLLFNTGTPIFEAPDEDGHYLFVRYLQVYHTLPVQDLDINGPRAHHPPLYHLLGALFSAWVPVRDPGARRIDMQPNPKAYFRYDDPERDNKAMWVHYGPEERWPYSGQALVVHLVRLLSLAFSTVGVLCTYLAARPLRPGAEGERLGLLAAALVAFHPMVLFMSGVLQNNTTMLAAGGAVVYALSRGLRRGFTGRTWVGMGVLLGLGVLLQLSSLVLAAPIGLALLYAAATAKPAQRWRTLFGGGLAIALPMLALTGWWFLRNRALYGDWTGNNVVAQMWCCDPIQPWPALRLFLTGLLGRFGQGLMITYPNPVYYAAGVVGLAALAGWLPAPVLLGWAWRKRPPTPTPATRRALTTEARLWLLHVSVIASVCGALVFYAVTVAPGLPGRYLFPAFPSVAVVVAGGWLAWFGNSARARTLGALALAGLMLAAALYGLYGLLLPTYAPPRTASAGEISRATPLDANIGDTAQVLGYALDTATAHPGGIVQVTIYWRPLSRTDVPYTVFLQLYDPAQGVIAQLDSYPGQGNYATTVWDVGHPLADVYRLKIPADAPAATGRLVFGLYNGADGLRLPVTGADAGPAELAWVQLGTIVVAP